MCGKNVLNHSTSLMRNIFFFTFIPSNMQVNCILEAFGHAKTPRNCNSSRFIKLLSIQYCEKTKMMLRGNLCKTILFVSFNLTIVLFFSLIINILETEVHNRSIEPITNHANLISGDFFSAQEHNSKAPAGGSKSPLISHIAL